MEITVFLAATRSFFVLMSRVYTSGSVSRYKFEF